MSGFIKKVIRNRFMLLMILPGTIWFLIFAYLPMFGTVLAFKDFRISPDGFFASVFNSEWVGFKNFEYLFTTNDAYIITRNTILYNLAFIILGLIIAVGFAIMLSELVNKRTAKVYQTGMFLPHFLSWVIISYFAFTFLSVDKGTLNQIITYFGGEPISWYAEAKYWPFILVFVGIWKGVGYNSVIYLAAITGIDKSYYEAAVIDGANKWKQTRYITIPLLKPLMIILTILAIGGIFRSDFGLFYQLPKDSGALYPVTNVIDTFVYRGLINMGDIGMSTAAGLYQSLVGLVLILVANYIVRRIEKDHAIF
ncbi:sugar ABC transporter permease [Virgibacillus sp. LDC1]|uniref:ABC transporter permease n=1 Tax=Paenibacillus TaxID=44249 RepID=UPI0008DD62DC|nr:MULTISPECIES: sugar ABC transporter permease [Paenibacillus]MCV4235106.1 sugar ABC transporter permease [Virgibacillus sp. LDC1]MBU5349664.1 sugar ABC transporter permease [Paenibacillus lautus]MBX4151877.1 sugar ABC transporter permease [Paenibacillus lautus]MCT1398173.1 sugar ABC transporter permease [Paenibacillus sp. p3-SID867]MEC0253986.1 sugar ABC transporter permease [Paenibacillus lautus]